MELWKPFADAFDADELTLFRTDHWTVLVRKAQITLGTLVLAANRNFISGAELTLEELAEFPEAVRRLEEALQAAFSFDRINYLCLMMTDRHYHYHYHYHFHVVPRYEGTRNFNGESWSDDAWPGPPSVAAPETDRSILIALRDYLREVQPNAAKKNLPPIELDGRPWHDGVGVLSGTRLTLGPRAYARGLSLSKNVKGVGRTAAVPPRP